MLILKNDVPASAQPLPDPGNKVGHEKSPKNKGKRHVCPTSPTCARVYAYIFFSSFHTKVQKQVSQVRQVRPNKHWSGFRVAQPLPNRPYLKAGVSHA